MLDNAATQHALRTADQLSLGDHYRSALPGDDSGHTGSRQVPQAMWSAVAPVEFAKPSLVAWSAELAATLGLDIAGDKAAAASVFTGQQLADNSQPFAMRYGGHQFGNWAGQLGDGRAITLGEITAPDEQHWTLQLKGAGPTPYSRGADGMAVLRSSVREFMCSEAMFHLGIPTTRALTLCLTGNHVNRDVFYDGNVVAEQGAIVCRAAPSFVRFGNFEIHAAHQELDQLRALTDYVIARDYPHLGKPGPDTWQQWFAEVLQRTITLVCHWQRVGFVHAVMNTDNMSITGHTIDYGPYGWLEEYDPRWTPNYIDNEGRRYSYGNQPEICRWNLYRLANALVPLFGETKPLEEVLDSWSSIHDPLWRQTQADKLGIADPDTTDDALFNELRQLMQHARADYTVFFRCLATINCSQQPDAKAMLSSITPALYDADQLQTEVREQLGQWLLGWRDRANRDGRSDPVRSDAMNACNPAYVLRNYLAIEAIDAAENGDYSVLESVMEVMRDPYREQPGKEEYAKLRPQWATQRPGCTMLTCSS